jgi:EF hand
MSTRRSLLISLAGLVAIAVSPALARSGLPKGLDTDADGTLDLAEAKQAAGELFDKLDKDHEGTLDASELHVRLTKAEIGAADPDKDKTLTKDEFLAVVEKRFNAADLDHDGALDAKELHGKAGRALLKLLK